MVFIFFSDLSDPSTYTEFEHTETGPPRDLFVDDLVLALCLVLPLVVAGVLVVLILVLILFRVTLDAASAACTVYLHSAYIKSPIPESSSLRYAKE